MGHFRDKHKLARKRKVKRKKLLLLVLLTKELKKTVVELKILHETQCLVPK